MNRKFEDKLARHAFGEMSAKESSALERKVQSDPEAARLLAEYQGLKSGLNLLTEIPPDQLSKERLRDAILGQGLKPLPIEAPSSRWGWAWMPAAAAGLAFAWLGVRHMNAPAPRIVESSTTVAMMDKPATVLTISHAPALVKPIAPQIHKTVEDSAVHLVVKHSVAAPAQKAAVLAVNHLIAPQKPTTTLAKNDKAKAAPPLVAPDSSDTNGKLVSINGPLVVISSENDNNSGAQKATEVDGASDVGPVGG